MKHNYDRKKNLLINRIQPEEEKLSVFDLKPGDVFEREGAPHMVVHICDYPKGVQADEITVCNLSTGSVWACSKFQKTRTFEAVDPKLTYTVGASI